MSVRRPRVSLASVAVVVLTPFLGTCQIFLDLCPPVDGRVGFFSKGDCVFTRGSFFAGHEWITFFGNQDNDISDQFSDEEIQAIADGNRRVDFPLEMLVHLNTSVLAYASAIVEYQDRPENQPVHFLLNADNLSVEAKANAEALMLERTKEAVRSWVSDRERALTLIGQVCHTVQDSYSEAHAVRLLDVPERPVCIDVLKSYVSRAPGFEQDRRGMPVQFHGGQDTSNIGHTTTEDSIYREGRDCHSPVTAVDVRSCFSPSAERAVEGTGDYLRLARALVVTRSDDEVVERVMNGFFERRMRFCEDP